MTSLCDKSRPDISVVSPVYRAANLVSTLVTRIRNAVEIATPNYEIVLVDDGSPDGSWKEIQNACKSSAKVVGYRLSRNFGQHPAIAAGISKARGKWVVVMDCDLQDKPEEIPRLLEKAVEGYDIVLARRAQRRDTWLKRMTSRFFYGTLGYLTGTKQDSTIANFGIYSHKVITAINAMPENLRYFPTMVRWVGFKVAQVDVDHAERQEGGSSYSIRKLLNLALDICISYSDKPLRLAIATGFAISATGLLFAVYIVASVFLGKIVILGYASLIVSIWVLMGLNIAIVGIVGLYVGKSFEAAKRRPIFIVAESINEA